MAGVRDDIVSDGGVVVLMVERRVWLTRRSQDLDWRIKRSQSGLHKHFATTEQENHTAPRISRHPSGCSEHSAAIRKY